MEFKNLKLSLSIELEAYEIYRDLLIKNKFDIITTKQEENIIDIKIELTNVLINNKKKLFKDYDSFDKTLIALLAYFQTNIEELRIKTRKYEIVKKRFIIYYYLSERTDFSQQSMVDLFNQKNHSSAHHGKTTIKNLLDIGDVAMTKLIHNINFYLDYYETDKDKISSRENDTFKTEPAIILSCNEAIN